MITPEHWDDLERLIKNGLSEYALPTIVKEIKEQLTEQQLKPLGDLNKTFSDIFSRNNDTAPRDFVTRFIDMAKKGVIKHKGFDETL